MRHSLLAATLLLAASATLGNAACAPTLAPVYAPAQAAGVGPSGAPYTQEQVDLAVVQGAQAKGWTVIQHAPGLTVAEVAAGGHSARVRVLTSAGGWRIVHEQSSPGLKHEVDPRHGEVIHRRYNHWVRLLDESIRAALATQANPTVPPGVGGAAPTPQQPAAPAR